MTHSYRLLQDASLSGKRVLLRAGFDVPITDGVVEDTTRIEAMLPTMRYILDAGASLILLAHQGRPKDAPDPQFSERPLVEPLQRLLNTTVRMAPSCSGAETQAMADALQPGEVLLLENLRFDPREKKNDPAFAKELAALGDMYVNDAFTNCHREHASMVALAQELPAYMGLQLQQEVQHLEPLLQDPVRPLTLIISGAKMETKIPVIENFLRVGNDILTGGCIANTFIAAQGHSVGTSRYEENFLPQCKDLLKKSAVDGHATVHVPVDATIAQNPDALPHAGVSVAAIPSDMAIFDPGTSTQNAYCAVIAASKTIVWNGPLGLYETEAFAASTKAVAQAIAQATKNGAISVVGGGDTIDAHNRYGIPLDAYTFVSTGGGAMLEFLAGASFPALKALRS